MKPKFLFCHHKCASRFFRHLFQNLGFEVLNYTDYLKRKVVLVNIDELDLETLDERFTEYNNYPNCIISIINTTAHILEIIEQRFGNDFSAIHVVRDPRDILVSGYFHHLEGHPIDNSSFYWPELEKIRPLLNRLNKEAGMLLELNTITRRVLESQIKCIPQKRNILTVRLEDFALEPTEKIKSMSSFLDLAVSTDMPTSHIPRGKSSSRKNSQDWQEHFTLPVKLVFKERYGQLLINLGYENDMNW